MAGLVELSVRFDAPAPDNKYIFRLVRIDEIIDCALTMPAMPNLNIQATSDSGKVMVRAELAGPRKRYYP